METTTPARENRPALWAGVECTVNRVGDIFLDQLERNGHALRPDDLDAFAALGVQGMRYPVLWERVAPAGLARADWSWPDARLGRLRALGVRPIVGLVHHGSGPRDTSLVDPAFPERLADYAAAVAARYPWVRDYTPVNEPLTTARFSGLYGHWYPHGRDLATFVRALLNQCRAVALSMQAIRRVQPAARLIQTEDLGKVWSTPALAYQAAFENERRWLSIDLLCGAVGPDHAMWGYLRDGGATPEELEWFRANPCPPDVIGVNTYLSSERFLDERLDRYPAHTHGGNGRERYADIEAVRVRGVTIERPRGLLLEAWRRYGRPLAITEAHNGCTREEQLRWLVELWEAACDLRSQGAAVEAVTVWALLGSYDWNSLVTRDEGHYEPGVFDVRGPRPRPTALAALMRDLAAGREPRHPALAGPGWWQRPERFLYACPCVEEAAEAAERLAAALPGDSAAGPDAPRPLLITGASGTLGQAFARLCHMRGLATVCVTRHELDIADPAAVEAALERHRPWAVVNTAGYVRVDDAERERELCFRANTSGAAVLAAACARRQAQLLTFSSDLVFDGRRGAPYREHDPAGPLNTYGRSKAAAERRVLDLFPEALIVRTSAFFGPWDGANFVTQALGALAREEPVVAADDLVVSPTYVPDLVQACLDLLIDGEAGIWHLANEGAISWADLARRAARMAGCDEAGVRGVPSAALGRPAPQPRYSALGSARGALLPSLDDALRRYMAHRGAGG